MHCIKFNDELLIYCAGYIITVETDCGITSNLTGKTIHFIDHKPDIVNTAAAALQKNGYGRVCKDKILPANRSLIVRITDREQHNLFRTVLIVCLGA
jgi:hypothetical protein